MGFTPLAQGSNPHAHQREGRASYQGSEVLKPFTTARLGQSLLHFGVLPLTACYSARGRMAAIKAVLAGSADSIKALNHGIPQTTLKMALWKSY